MGGMPAHTAHAIQARARGRKTAWYPGPRKGAAAWRIRACLPQRQPDQPQQAAAGRPEPVGEGIHAGVERLQLGGLFVQLALQLGEESALRRACVGIPLGVGANGYNGVQKGVKLCCKRCCR